MNSNSCTRKTPLLNFIISASFFTFIGILVRYFFNSISHSCESKPIVAIYTDYITQNFNFIDILIRNTSIALILFFIPCVFVILLVAVFPYFSKIYFVSIGKNDEISVTSYFPKVIVAIFCIYIAVGFLTFSSLYCTISLLPIHFYFSNFVHGIPEFLGFFLAGYLGLKICNDIKEVSDSDGNITLMKIFPIFEKKLKKYAQYLIIIVFIIFIAACIEVWITPQIWIKSFENYFIANNITIPATIK